MDAITTRAPRTPRQPKPVSDLDTAARFLNVMGGDAGYIATRTFTDDAAKKANDRGKNNSLLLPVFPQDLYELDAQNRQGRGIFWVVNEGGQRAQEITRIRALFVDYDGDDLAGFLKRLDTMPPPHAIVESSPGKRHVYWKCQGVPVAEFKAMQQGLIAKLGTDKGIHDLPRVLRVPGFLHQKGKPQLVRLLRLDEKLPPYTLDQCRGFAKNMQAGAKKEKRPPREPRQPSLPAQAAPPADAEKEALMAYINEAAKKVRPRAEVEAEQRAYDLACAADAVGFFQKRGMPKRTRQAQKWACI